MDECVGRQVGERTFERWPWRMTVEWSLRELLAIDSLSPDLISSLLDLGRCFLLLLGRISSRPRLILRRRFPYYEYHQQPRRRR